MKLYSSKEVAKLLGLSLHQVRSYARPGLLQPERGSRGEYRFSFRDLVLLRTAKDLLAARIPPRKVRRALLKLREQLPTGRPLTGVRIRAEGERVLVHEGASLWNAESGQGQLNFEVSERSRRVASHARRMAQRDPEAEIELGPDDWHALGTDLEATSPDQAREAYRRALELDPRRAATRVNLGRLLHEQRRYGAAEAHYRLALSEQPSNVTASFHLGVCLEDQGRFGEAVAVYEKAIADDPASPDPHFNLARLFERLGQEAAALDHLRTYRKLTEDG